MRPTSTWQPTTGGGTLRQGVPAVLAVLLAMVIPAVAAGQAAPAGEVTFSKHIAPILQRSCQSCHRPGQVAPMSLISYQDVRPWARGIKLRTGQREMPPWFIEKDVGIQEFKDDPSLSNEEIAMIATWADNGAPEGNPADMPPPVEWRPADKWSFGTPDLVVSSPARSVAAVEADWQGDVEPTAVGLSTDRYIAAVEVKEVVVPAAQADAAPSAAAGTGESALGLYVVHHAIIGATTELGGDDDGPVGTGSGNNFGMAHEAGQNATFYPEGLGVLLPADSYLTWEMHTHANGEPLSARLDVGFKLHPEGYTPKYTGQDPFGGGMLANHDLDIPAGEDNVRFDAVRALATAAKMITFEPHMHASGKRMCLQAHYPSGAQQTLNCSGYNHNWIKVYSYADDAAPLLPAGTILQVIGWYDNSRGNPNNAEPRNWKGFGNRSIEDMLFYLGKFVPLTEEQYEEESAARGQRSSTATQNNN